MTFKSWVTFGLIPLFCFGFWNSDYYKEQGTAMYGQFGVEAEYKGLFLNGFIQDTFYKADGVYFHPDSDIFMVNAGYRNEYFEIGYRHCCTHPVIPFIYEYAESLDIYQEGGWDEIYLTLMFSYQTKEKRQ